MALGKANSARGYPRRSPAAAFDAYRSFVSSRRAKASREAQDVCAHKVSDRIKASVTVLEFVGQYVDLKPTASGAVGLCPFHDDHYPNFGVNEEGNSWHCFAGCGGDR